MGDFNADGSYFDEDGTSDLDEYTWLIDDSADTTTKSTDYTYDRIVITDTSDFAGETGVFRYDLEYGLNQELTEDVSDHYPVYAEFWINRDDDISVVGSETLNTSSTPSTSEVEITGLSLEDEWVEITNNGEDITSLDGWYITDEAGQTYTFAEFSLEPAVSVKIYTSEGSNSDGDLYWDTSNIWNNDGDVATLYNGNDKVVNEYAK
jgi:hypothetical protein